MLLANSSLHKISKTGIKESFRTLRDWILGAGFNTVNNSGAGFKELTNSDHWAFGKIPFYGSVETNFATKWRAKATLSFNYFKDGKAFNGATLKGESEGGNDAGYAAFDLAAQYYFLESKKYEPYLLAGMGLSHFGDYSTTQRSSYSSGTFNCSLPSMQVLESTTGFPKLGESMPKSWVNGPWVLKTTIIARPV